jgi:hypothetical protein
VLDVEQRLRMRLREAVEGYEPPAELLGRMQQSVASHSVDSSNRAIRGRHRPRLTLAAAFAAVIVALVVLATLGSVAIVHSGSTTPAHHSKSTIPTRTTLAPKPTTSTTTPFSEEPAPSSTPTGMTLQFTSLDDGWQVGGRGILATTDGGVIWRASYTVATRQYVDSIDFVNDNDGWAIIGEWNKSGNTFIQYLIRTVDGGRSWHRVATRRQDMAAVMDFITPNVGWVVTEEEHVFVTDDGGVTWRSVSIPAQAFSLCAEPGGKTWMAGANEDIYLSTDSGGTWRLVLPLSEVPDVYKGMPRMFEPPRIVCSGSSAWAEYAGTPGAGNQPYEIESTLDNGLHWSTRGAPLGTLPSYFGLTGASDGWLFGFCSSCDSENIWFSSTTNAGATFQDSVLVRNNGLFENPYGTSFLDRDYGWVLTSETDTSGLVTGKTVSHQVLLGTSDAGATWHVVDPSVP